MCCLIHQTWCTFLRYFPGVIPPDPLLIVYAIHKRNTLLVTSLNKINLLKIYYCLYQMNIFFIISTFVIFKFYMHIMKVIRWHLQKSSFCQKCWISTNINTWSLKVTPVIMSTSMGCCIKTLANSSNCPSILHFNTGNLFKNNKIHFCFHYICIQLQIFQIKTETKILLWSSLN